MLIGSRLDVQLTNGEDIARISMEARLFEFGIETCSEGVASGADISHFQFPEKT